MGIGMKPEFGEDYIKRERESVIRQLNPHFLFNVLGALRIEAQTDADIAYDRIYDLSKYFRTVFLALEGRENILFREEAASAVSFLNLEKLRFGDAFTVYKDFGTEDFMLPPMSVLPLVDNAVRHGLLKGERKGAITIRSRELPAEYIVQVEDDGVGFDAAWFERMPGCDGPEAGGLRRVRYRVEHMAKGRLDVQSCPETGTVVTIQLPKTER